MTMTGYVRVSTREQDPKRKKTDYAQQARSARSLITANLHERIRRTGYPSRLPIRITIVTTLCAP